MSVAPFFGNGTKVKVSSEIKPPLGTNLMIIIVAKKEDLIIKDNFLFQVKVFVVLMKN